MSREFTHHHLMSNLKIDLDTIQKAREALEAMGLLKTYLKETEIKSFVYELYSPLSATDFFSHPVFNVVLYNNIGKKEYEMIKALYEKINFNLKDYEDISKSINTTFKSVSNLDSFAVKDKETLSPVAMNIIDFELLLSSLPKGLITEKTLNKKTRELINNLAFIYNLDTLKMSELVRGVINEKGFIDKDELRKSSRKFYQYNNSGTLPTLVYRHQPDYLKNPGGDNTNRGKIIYGFENTTPYDFLKSKYKGVSPTTRDLRLLENLLVDIGLKPAVVNVLIDYVLKQDNNKLNQNYIETIAGQWKRLGIETASEAMDIAKKEHRKYQKKTPTKKTNSHVKEPVWFNEDIKKEEIGEEEKTELEELLKEFR